MAFTQTLKDEDISFAIGTVVYNPEHDVGQCRVCGTRYEVRNGFIVDPVTASLVSYCVACKMSEEKASVLTRELNVNESETLTDWGAF
jgi:hypothetical protein